MYSVNKRRLTLLSVLLLVTVAAAVVIEVTPGVPNIFNPTESLFQQQTHFLVFTGSNTPGETPATEKAYYNSIDPTHSKLSFPQWLVKAGFISDASQWHPAGPQIIACGDSNNPLPGCDMPKSSNGTLNYGDNIINADAHAIVLNAADLGFVRNQFVRCIPSCTAANPIIYTYLENYPVNPFAASGKGGSGFPKFTGYPTTAEATQAIDSALNRPLGNLPGCDPSKTDTILGCSVQRIADVAFEWASSPTNSNSARYGQLYAYIFSTDGSGIGDQVHTQETLSIPPDGFQLNLKSTGPTDTFHVTPNVATKTLNPINAGDGFPPNLDFLGFKEHPGVCFICHGGKPRNLTSSGAYPNQGNVSGFRFLPLDNRNLMFTSDAGGEQPALPTSVAFADRANQEKQIKVYNQAVLATVPKTKENDGTGATRVAHLREVILGWYAAFPGDTNMLSDVQNTEFIPQGWLESVHGGTAPAGSEALYLTTLSPSCRSCHFNREVSLDFGTAANFKQDSDMLQLTLLPFCKQSNPPKGAKAMPLAHLTYQRYWQANSGAAAGSPVTLPYPASPSLSLVDSSGAGPADQIAKYFGYPGLAGYCASNP